MKRLLSVLVVICILSGMIISMPLVATGAESGTCGAGLTWTFDGGTLKISGEGNMYEWKSISDIPWFSIKDSILNIDIDNRVTSITKDAFYGTAYYNNPANWENNVLYIGGYLVDAKSGTVCAVKDGTICIGDYAFSYCTNLKEITVPNSVKYIGRNVFYNCSGLNKINLSDSVLSINDGAFFNCTGLFEITIPVGVSYIGDEIFAYCTNLKNITVHKDNPYYSSIDGILFDKAKTKLIRYPVNRIRDTYYVPYSVTSIENGAFSGCIGVGRVVIPKSVRVIGDNAFLNCTEMSGIIIPENVTRIGKRAFYNTGYYNISGNWQSGLLYIEKYLIAANSMEECVIKDGTVCIADGVFKNCEDLSNVIIPKSVKYIGNAAFSGCEKLISVNVPSGVTSIGNETFYECTGLMGISIPVSVKSIGALAFYNCKKLAGVFYAGNETQWKNINIGIYNNHMTGRKIYYNYELVPAGFVFEQNDADTAKIEEELKALGITDNLDQAVSLEIEQTRIDQSYEEGNAE